MTDLAIVNTPSTVKMPEAPSVTSCGGRLQAIMETAQRLRIDAEWLEIDANELLFDLKDVVADSAMHDNAALAAALDSATWLHSAAENIESEFSALIDHLFAATEA